MFLNLSYSFFWYGYFFINIGGGLNYWVVCGKNIDYWKFNGIFAIDTMLGPLLFIYLFPA